MKTAKVVAVAALVLGTFGLGAAQADMWISTGYVAPTTFYYAPRTVYVAPAAVYVSRPAPVVYYYSTPVTYVSSYRTYSYVSSPYYSRTTIIRSW